jgi:hypothetical protein
MHIYFLDSLATTMREFRTIKSCEFYATSQIILDPSIGLKPPNDVPQDDKGHKMLAFIEEHKYNFNES